MQIVINDEWRIEDDASSWNLVYQSAEISEKTGKRNSTVETTYHANIEQACAAYIDDRLTKAASKSDKAVASLQDLIAVVTDAKLSVHEALKNFFQEVGDEGRLRVPRTFERGADPGGAAPGPDGGGDAKPVRKAAKVRPARGVPAADDKAGAAKARL